MVDYLDYRFGPMAQTIAAVQKEHREFAATLAAFKESYDRLARLWGGDASANASSAAVRIDELGNETAKVVHDYINALEEHLAESRRTESMNTDLFA